MPPFTPLHCHSEFSFHAGVGSINELVDAAAAFGIRALALTDTNRMSGLIRFYLRCRERGIKPILGVELTRPDHRPPEQVVLLARNNDGYGDLCEITTQRHIDPAFSFERIFSRPWPNLFLFTPTPSLLRMLAATPNRENLFAELINTSAESRERSRGIHSIAQRLEIPVIASNDSYFPRKEDGETHRILRAIGLNSTLSRLRPDEYASPNAWFRSGEDMERLFPNHPDAITTTNTIADRCDVNLDLGTWIMPEIDVPSGFTPATFLERVAREGLEKNYGGTPQYERARHVQTMELETIAKLGYPSYFLIVKEIRDWANERFKTRYRRPRDCTLLRGSAANSITFYNIGVSDLDPIRYDLYFQRFLNEDRASPPDADLDFGWDERDKVFDFISGKWGQDRVAVTCTTNHFRRRAAFRETAKVFGYTEEQISAILKSHATRNQRIEDSEILRIMEVAEKIRGKPRFLGQHPGGLLITNDPIRRHVACEYSGGIKNRIVTQIDMHNGIDELGLIKFDILGNGSLSVLRDTLVQLEEQHLPDPEVWDLEKCFADSGVREIIRNGRTRGIFYIESPAQMRLNKKAQVETFEELAITSSLIRPAGTSYTETFVKRHRDWKQGIKNWDFIHPSLESILGDTHDVCAFQEDVTKICHHVAGLSYKKSDSIRKQMNSQHEGSVDREKWERIAREFIDGCMTHSGLNPEQALELWKRVSSFSGFSFCKSHSASYARLSFKCSYLKIHYPAQFLAAVISNNHGFYTRDVYLDEARRWGIRILPMDINESMVAYRGKHAWMRPGFMHIRNLGTRSMESIVAQRTDNGPFRNLIDFVKRTKVGKKEIESLILVGAFDRFGLTQPESLFLLDSIYGKIRDEQTDLFRDDMTLRRRLLHPGLSDYALAQKCFNELHLLGFMLSGNILEILDLHPASRDAVPADQIPRHSGKRIKIFGWPVTRRIHDTMMSDDPMMFLTVEDKTECADVVIWPKVYDRFFDVLLEPGPFEIWGRVGEEYDTFTVEADYLRPVAWSPVQVDFELASRRLEQSFKQYTYEYADIGRTRAA